MPQDTHRSVELPVKLDDRHHQPIRSHRLRAALAALAFTVLGPRTGIDQRRPTLAAVAMVTRAGPAIKGGPR